MISEGQVVAAFTAVCTALATIVIQFYRDTKAQIADNRADCERKLADEKATIARLQQKIDADEAANRHIAQSLLEMMTTQSTELQRLRETVGELMTHLGDRR